MEWIKKGLIFSPNKTLWWQQKYAILPTPLVLNDKIRVFFATTCENNIGRITFIDLDINNPGNILFNPENYIIDKGATGCFDENGLNPSSINFINGRWHLYYAGYQRHLNSPYSIFSGLLVSDDCLHFERYSQCPILDRNNRELSIRSAPSIIKDNNIYKMWYVSNESWINVEGDLHKGKLFPKYSIRYGESLDGVNWKIKDDFVLKLNENEFGFGRPYIFRNGDHFLLFYSIRSVDKSYRIGYAKSKDGMHWERDDDTIGIDVSEEGWDSEMICYPAVISANNKTYLFYNGNNNGEVGFGYAELKK